jgi:hypothetical protein
VDLDAVSPVIADRHAPSASTAHGEALEEGGGFAGGTAGTVAAVGGGIGRDSCSLSSNCSQVI